MGVRKALNDFYKGLVKSADKNKKGGGKSTQRKKKRESSPQKSTQKSNGTRGTGVSRNTSSSSGESSRPSSNNRPSTSSNKSQTKSSSPATKRRSGAIGPATKAGVMGGNTSSKKSTTQFKIGGKTIGPVTKAGVMGGNLSAKKGGLKGYTVDGKTVRTVTKAGITGSNKKGDKDLADWKAQQREKQGKKTNALGVETKTHTGTWGNPVGKAVVDVASQVTTRTRTNVGAINEAKKQAKKDQKKFEKDYNYKLSDQEKKEWRQDYYDQTIKALSSKKSKKEIDKAAKELAKASGVKGGSYKAQDLTNEDYLKIQNATRVDPETGRKMLGDKLAKKVGSNTAYNATKNTASKVTTGIMQGMSYGDVVHGGPGIYGKEEKQAIKELQESGAYNIGYGAGMLGGFAISGVGGAGKAIAQTAGKGAAKGLAKATTKSAGKKFAQNRLGELAAETPLNALDAVKMSRDENGNINKKEALKWMGINTALTGGMGAAIEGAGMKLTKKQAKQYIELAAKQKTGLLTADESVRFEKLRTKLARSAEDVQAAKSNAANAGVLEGDRTLADAVSLRQARADAIKNKTPHHVGKATTIKHPYVGDMPVHNGKRGNVVSVKPNTISEARSIIKASRSRQPIRTFARELLGKGRTVNVKNTSFNGEKYSVYIGPKAVKKVVDSNRLSPQEIAIFKKIDDVISNAEYLDSGKNVKENKPVNPNVIRYDYFETEVKSGKKNYVVSFDVEVFAHANNYRTHKVRDLQIAPSPDKTKTPGLVGPVTTTRSSAPSLDFDESIADKVQKSKPQNVGYHAGDLGKSESHGQQAGSHRHTGGYGTGVYFVGDEKLIGKGTGYGDRPHEVVDFDDYNLYRPDGVDQGRRVHDNLIKLNRGSHDVDRLTRTINITDDDVRVMKDLVDTATYSPENLKKLNDVAETVLSKNGLENFEHEVDDFIASRKPRSDEEVREEAERLATQSRTEMEDFGLEMSDIEYEKFVNDLFNDLREPQKPREEVYFNMLSDRLSRELDGDVGFGSKSFLDEIEESKNAIPQLAKDLGKSEGEVRTAIENAADTIRKYDGDTYKQDSMSTLIMKELGFEGVDVRGIKGLDNTEHGSVIYELKGSAKDRKAEIDAAKTAKISESATTKPEPEPSKPETSTKAENDTVLPEETGPENPLFREWKDLDAELKDLNTKEFTPDAEKRSDEIISRINEISEELGGGRVTKENADEALKAIEAQRASDETLVKNNEDVIKNSDDELAGIERPAPDSAEMPKDLKANKKASRPIKDDVQDALNRTDGEYTFKASEKKEIDESFDRISNRIANGDDAGAKADAEELVEKHFHFDAEEKEPNTGYKEKRKELKDLQKYLRSRAWEMPEGSARTLDEFLEAIGLPKNATRNLPIRKWSNKDNVMGKKGAHRDVIFKGGKLPRAQIDDEWAALCREYPEYFKPEDAGSTEKQFQALAEAAMYDPNSIPEFKTRELDDAEIKDWKESKVDEILDLARKNAGTYRGIDEPTPLKPLTDDMGEDELAKAINGQKKHLDNAIKKYGEGAPRVKEIRGYISDAEKKLDAVRGETKLKSAAKTPKKPEPEGTPEGFAAFEADAAKRGIKDTPEETYTKKVKETKKELDDVVKQYGEDSPRAKETKARLEDYEERLADAKHEKETGQKTSNTGDAPQKTPAEATIDEPRTRLGKSWSAFYRVSVDSFADIEKAAKKIGGKQGQALLSQINAVRNSKNISASWITDRRSNWNRETVGKSLDKIFKQAGNGAKRQDFIDYCYHKHNLERLDVDKPISGMPREAEESLAAIKDLEAKYGNKIKDFQQEIVKYADDLLQYKVDAGIVSKAEADALRKYKNYIPTFTNKDFKGTINEDLSQGISVDRGLRRAVGGNEEDQLVDLYQQLAQSTRSTMKHTEMNEMIRMLGDLQGIKYSEIDKSVSPDQMLENSLFTDKSNGSYYATYYDADGAHTISIPEGMFKGIQEWTGEEKAILVNNGLVRGFGVPGRMFKNLVTGWNVIFGVRNGVRDLATALTYTKDLKGFAMAYPKAVKTVLTRKGPYWDAYIAAGGKYSSLAKTGGADGFMDALDSFKGSPLTWAKEINDTIETMPRMMEFISTVDKAGGINGAGREVINRAMKNANDVTLNFGRSGVAGRMLNSGFVPYINPSIQGLDKLFRVFTEAKQEKNFRGLIGLGMKMSTFAIAPAVFNEYMLRDNEDYQQLNTRDKDSNYFIPLGDGKFIKIPKARELVVVAEPAQYFFRHAQFGDSGGWKQMFQSAVDNIGVVNPLTDNLVSPLYRVATNKTWFGGNIETAYEVDNLLPQDRYDEGTTLVAIDLAQKNPAKALGLSPKKIDNLIDSYTGVIGDFFIPMNSKASKGNPFVNKFITDSVLSNKLSTEAWDTYEKLKQESNSTTLDPKKVQDSKYKLQDFYNGYLGDTVTLNQAITDIQNNDKLTKAEKHDLVRQLKLSQNEIYRSSKDGSTPKLNGKEVDPLTAIFNLYNGRKDTKAKAVGITFKYAHKNYQESYEKYKGSEEYEKMTGKEKSRSRVKYLKYVTTIRDTRGKIGEEKDKFIDYKTVAVVGQMKNASESMMDSFGTGNQGLYKYLKENAKTYKDYKYDLNHFIETEKTVVDSSRKIGLDYRSQMQNHDVSMSLAHKERDDGSYYIGDKKPEYQSTRMDPARYLVEKDKKQWSTKRIHDFADKHGYNYESDYDVVYKMAKKTYPDKSEKEWAAVAQVITGKGDNDFGDMSRKGDTGIMGNVGNDERGGGRGGRGRRGRGRGRGGRGGGGGSGGTGATMPKTASGAIKGKVTNTYKSVISDKSIRSNLDDAYRKKAKKLREQSRKRK